MIPTYAWSPVWSIASWIPTVTLQLLHWDRTLREKPGLQKWHEKLIGAKVVRKGGWKLGQAWSRGKSKTNVNIWTLFRLWATIICLRKVSFRTHCLPPAPLPHHQSGILRPALLSTLPGTHPAALFRCWRLLFHPQVSIWSSRWDVNVCWINKGWLGAMRNSQHFKSTS